MISKRQFLVTAALFFAIVIGCVKAKTDFLQQQVFEAEARIRTDMVANFGKACRTYTKKILRPAVEKHTDEMVFEAMSSTFVTNGIFEAMDQDVAAYRYSQVVLNPLNLEHKADATEAALIDRFRDNPNITEVTGYRMIDDQEQFFVANPVVVEQSCLKCHGDVDSVPSEIVQRYGRDHGYNWKTGETVGSLIVSVPTRDLYTRHASLRANVLLTFGALAVILIGVSYLLFSKVHDRTSELSDSETKLRLSEARFRAMFESAVDPLVTIDASGIIQTASRSVEAVFGWKPDELLGQSIDVLLAPSGQDQHGAFTTSHLCSDRSALLGKPREQSAFRRDGTTFPAIVTLWQVDWKDQSDTLFMGTIHDITESKKTDAELKRFRAALDISPDTVFLVDRETMCFIDMNETAYAALGYRREELFRLGPAGIKPDMDPQELAQEYDAIIESPDPTGAIEAIHCRKDGSTFPVEILVRALKVDGGTHLITSVRDITERKSNEAKLELLNKRLVESARLAGQSEVATSVLHNVGNVLNSVNVSAGMIQENVQTSHVTSLTKAIDIMQDQEDLGNYITQDERGKHLPQFLADVSGQIAGQEQLVLEEVGSLIANIDHIKAVVATQQTYAKNLSGVMEKVSLAELIEDAININETSMIRHSVEITREFDEIDSVSVDKQKLLQIIVNLIVNAKNACLESENNDHQLTVRLRRTDEDRASIELRDNGMGIASENLIRIFAHGFTTRKEGHGFGLHCASLAAKELGGSLTAHSDGPGTGAAFILEIPMQPAEVLPCTI